jgi:hypothetical protein
MRVVLRLDVSCLLALRARVCAVRQWLLLAVSRS